MVYSVYTYVNVIALNNRVNSACMFRHTSTRAKPMHMLRYDITCPLLLLVHILLLPKKVLLIYVYTITMYVQLHVHTGVIDEFKDLLTM